MGFIILSMVLWTGYLFFKQSDSQNLKFMLLLIGCVILARIVLTPIVAILVHHHDRLKEQREQEGDKHEPKN